jgi:hypothetical protein
MAFAFIVAVLAHQLVSAAQPESGFWAEVNLTVAASLAFTVVACDTLALARQ